jgi:hypothetical protein
MKKLTLLLAITFLTAGLSSAQELVGFDTYVEAPAGLTALNNLGEHMANGIIEEGVMYKFDDGYGVEYDIVMSNTQSTIDILTLTNDILISNGIDPNIVDSEESDMEIDFDNYSVEELWVDLYLGHVIRKAWGMRVDGNVYAVILQMSLYSFTLTFTEV